MSSAGESELLERLSAEVRVLRLVSTRINSTLQLEEIYDIVLASMQDAFGFQHSQILLLEETGETLCVVAARGYPAATIGARLDLGVGVIGTVARRKKMMRVGNLGARRSYFEAIRKRAEEAGEGDRLGPAVDCPGLPDAESQVAIPLLIEDRLIGVFLVESREHMELGEHEETLIAIVANLCASAIHNALLYQREQQRRERLEGTVAERNRELSLVKELRAKEASRYDFDDLVGVSPPMREVRRLLEKVVESPASTILVTGENGTGKDLVAKIIHHQSSRAAGPFMNITCSALAPTLLESELFGHERGAFTDAHRQKKGLLELAHGGSVFLDEIGELGLSSQTRLLRFLEEKTFKRVGGSEDIRVDVRIIAATNRDLHRMVSEGSFREDLFYRLRVLEIELPPLRERHGDVPLLVKLFLDQFKRELNRDVDDVPPRVLEQLAAYAWPGNVRELRNAVERAVLLAEGRTLESEHWRRLAGPEECSEVLRLPETGVQFEEIERSLVAQALERADWNKARAARLLGMPRDWLRYRMEKFGLEPEAAVSRDYSRASRE